MTTLDYQNIVFDNIDYLLKGIISENKRKFFRRVWSTNPCIYCDRIKKIGFNNCETILDYGAGFGQWAIYFSKFVDRVYIYEKDVEKKKVTQDLLSLLGINNIFILESDFNFSNKSLKFDGIFLYSVLYYLDWKKTLYNFYENLNDNGIIYINSNDLGWYIYNLNNDHNAASDYNPKMLAMDVIQSFIDPNIDKSKKTYQESVTPLHDVLALMDKVGFRDMSFGADGSCGRNDIAIEPFFISHYKGIRAVYEILALK